MTINDFLFSYKDYFNADDLSKLSSHTQVPDDAVFGLISPRQVQFLGIVGGNLGVDRFYIKSYAMGALKLLLGVLCLALCAKLVSMYFAYDGSDMSAYIIWCVVVFVLWHILVIFDIFYLPSVVRSRNYRILSSVLG